MKFGGEVYLDQTLRGKLSEKGFLSLKARGMSPKSKRFSKLMKRFSDNSGDNFRYWLQNSMKLGGWVHLCQMLRAKYPENEFQIPETRDMRQKSAQRLSMFFQGFLVHVHVDGGRPTCEAASSWFSSFEPLGRDNKPSLAPGFKNLSFFLKCPRWS